MRNCLEIYRVASIALTAVALATLMACSTAPRIKPQPLAHWSGPEDCGTDYAAAVSKLAPERGAATALLVDSIGTYWNCMAIPEGRYVAEVTVRWSVGKRETTYLRYFEATPGQRLVVKAYEQDRGMISAAFSDLRIQPETVQTASANVGPSSSSEPPMAQPPGREVVNPAVAHDPRISEADAPSGHEHAGEVSTATSSSQVPAAAEETERESFKLPSITKVDAGKLALSIATAPIWAPYAIGELSLIVAGLPFVPVIAAIEKHFAERKRLKAISEMRAPDLGCCFVWIEDAATSAVIDGQRPALAAISDAR